MLQKFHVQILSSVIQFYVGFEPDLCKKIYLFPHSYLPLKKRRPIDKGIRDRNRALNGDIVIVEIEPTDKWNILHDNIQVLDFKSNKCI